MKSMPASSAMRANLRLSGQVPDQRSGTLVTLRPDEQLAPKRPSLSLLAPASGMRLQAGEFAFGTIIPQAWRRPISPNCRTATAPAPTTIIAQTGGYRASHHLRLRGAPRAALGLAGFRPVLSEQDRAADRAVRRRR